MVIPNPAMFFGILFMKNHYHEYEEDEYEEDEYEEDLYFEGITNNSATNFKS